MITRHLNWRLSREENDGAEPGGVEAFRKRWRDDLLAR
jgi:hypothetical protein